MQLSAEELTMLLTLINERMELLFKKHTHRTILQQKEFVAWLDLRPKIESELVSKLNVVIEPDRNRT